MGFGGIGIWQLVIILIIVIMLFGTKKLRGMGADLGGALKGFKKAMKDDDASGDTDDSAVINQNAEQKSSDTVSTKKADDI
jgi:sec-independent protein translocase protein TatA